MDLDYLTGLLTLKDFILQGEELVMNSDKKFAVVASDLSNFKYLNDMYGMESGDQAIIEMANFLYINNPNCYLACRTVGDQFRALVCVDGRTEEDEIKIISDMNTQLEKHLTELFPKVYLHVYTGLYFIDKSNFNMRIAIDKAHFAKKQMKNNFQIKCKLYQDDEFKDFSQQMEMVKAFENACVNDGIRVFFQPKFNCHTEELIGAEALCRILDDKGNVIPPYHFIPVLEKNGMLGRLDEIMMEKTFSHMREWMDLDMLTIPISINISRINFYNHDFVSQITDLQQKYGIPSQYIELEVTETTFIEDMDVVNTVIQELRSYGFKISVDDFGSGYSSLGLLTSMPADTIKLDCSFARQSLKSNRGLSIVKSIISMLKDVDFDIICEGIETKDEEQLIDSLGCSKIQGYLYDRPLPKEEFEKKYILVDAC